ncbi:YdcF family protein [Altererythrobacter sp. SALINAS58]|uniref:YdcF family protein n=1 Tax=Alteripontixanthobacter muriae TaxID=2705546 RepID=UPI001576CEA6|nr:YdcF family protein [Alteripontixanthobacter muriae]NTZ44014.1 YdcF family protein [Alteripontixanthobacter muriae]
MIRRFCSFVLVIWALGFLWFAAALPQPLEGTRTDAVIVPTGGGGGRIDRGLQVLRAGLADEMLVTGVDRDVKPAEFASSFNVSEELMECCITLGYFAVDTRGNAAETAKWLAMRNVQDLRLVTTDWHMRRAANELVRRIPADITLLRDAVRSEPTLYTLFLEYHKLLASQIAAMIRDA